MNKFDSKLAGSLSLFLFLFFCILPAHGEVWYVAGDAPGGGDGQSWDSPFDNIQSAVDAATSMYMECLAPLDQIWIKQDTYHLSEEIVVDKIVTILGGFNGFEDSASERYWANNQTIIDGGNSERCFNISALCEINGFTIRNGNAGSLFGGAIYILGGTQYCGQMDKYFSPSIRNCQIINNFSDAGGGISVWESDPIIRNCTFSNNSSPTGGAIYLNFASPKIEECIFRNNNSTEPSSLGGGAVCGVYHNTTTLALVEITNCLFYQNVSGSKGGAIACNQVYPTITNCSFSENEAEYSGGAFYGSPNSEAPKIWNSIFWGNTPDQLEINTPSTYLDVSYCDIQDGWTGPGSANIDANLQFIGGWELHLTPVVSPCIDSGANYLCPNDDLAGVDRPIDGDGNGTATCDMGVWEEPEPTLGLDDFAGLARQLHLSNHPNPFNPQTSIEYFLPVLNAGLCVCFS